MYCHPRLVPSSLLVGLVALGAVSAQATGGSPFPTAPAWERVFVTSVNNRILEVSFTNGATRTVVNSPGSSFRGLAVRGDFRIVVADHNGGGKVRIFDTAGEGTTITPAISFPSGVTVDPNQNVFVTNDHPGGWDEVWRLRRDFTSCLDGSDPRNCTGAGYEPAKKIDGPVKVSGTYTKRLADAKVSGGDLWVAVQDPPLLLRYLSAEDCYPCTRKTAIASQFFGGLSPTSLAFTEDEVLVSTTGGRILRFDLARASDSNTGNDHPLTPDFADVGSRPERIAAGLQGGALRVFVTVHPKTVRQYAILASGQGSLLKTVGSLQSPVGVNLASSKAAVTAAAGDDPVEVFLTTLEATFEKVTSSGVTDASCFTFVDPRESEPGAASCGPDGALHRDLPLTDPGLPAEVRSLNYPNVIPRYVRAFRQPAVAGENENNATGPPVFRFCQATTTAGFQTLVRIMGEGEVQWLGYDPECQNTNPARRPRFFYSEEPPEDPIIEGRVFINSTVMCNRDTNDSWKMRSIYVTGARDTRPADNKYLKVAWAAASDGSCKPEAGIVDCQLNRLKAVLDRLTAHPSCIGSSSRDFLRSKLDWAIYYLDNRKYEWAKSKLIAFERAIDCEEDEAGGDFSSCATSEVAGELRSRARAAIFGLCDGFGLDCPCSQVNPDLTPACVPELACPVVP